MSEGPPRSSRRHGSRSSRSSRASGSRRGSSAGISRRHLLFGGVAGLAALSVGWALLPTRQRLSTSQALPTEQDQHALNGWVKLDEGGQVTVMLARSEMGQGVTTALAMVLADELDADWRQVRTEVAPIDKIYNNLAVLTDGLPFHPDTQGAGRHLAERLAEKAARELGMMVTGGSTSIRDLWLPMREAGAAARAMLVAAATTRWRVPANECSTQAGRVVHAASGRSLGYGELAHIASLQPLPRKPVLKTPDRFTLIGRPQLRLEAAAKHDGSARFGLDTLQPEMAYAAVVMCPTLGGRVAAFDTEAPTGVHGVRKLLVLPPLHGASGGIAAVADTPWHALKAVALAAARVRWDAGPAATLDSAALEQQLRQALDGDDDGHAYLDRGDAAAALRGAARTLQADYQAPMLAHAALEPANCTVRWDTMNRRAEAWVGTQVPDLARRVVAEQLKLPQSSVELHPALLGGGFGRRLEVDVVAQAAFIARALPDITVQTFWSREQDATHDFYRPPCTARWRAALDAQGRLLAWSARSAGPSAAQQYLGRQFGLPAIGPDKTVAEGAYDQPYEVPAARVAHRIVETPLPVGFWRSVGHSHQAFFLESFVDECAAAAGQDPLAFRRGLLAGHGRARAVLERAAAMARWGEPPAPAPDGAPTALGLALHHSFGSHVAQVAQVSLDPADRRRIRVHRVWVAIDCGLAVNPGTVRQQMEGGVVFGLTAALHGQVTVAAGQVQQAQFHQQPLLRLSDCPEIVTEVLASTEPPAGVGEPGVPPIAPAVANALFRLTGQRLRRLPLALA